MRDTLIGEDLLPIVIHGLKSKQTKKSLCLETEDVSSFYTHNKRVVYFSVFN